VFQVGADGSLGLTGSVFNSGTQSNENHSIIFHVGPVNGTNNTNTPSVALTMSDFLGGTPTPVLTAGKDILVAKSFGVQLPFDASNPPKLFQ
jgi:hypothetical protein